MLSAYDIQDGHTVHLVAKPVRSATAADAAIPSSAHATTSTSYTDGSSSTIDAFARASSSTSDDDGFSSPQLRSHRDNLRRLMRSNDREGDDVDAATRRTSRLDEPRVLRPSYQSQAPTMRRRVPGPGDPTGAAWNMGVLREALDATSTNASPPRLHGLRELFGDDVLNDTATTGTSSSVASDLGLGASASSTAGVRPNLDHIFQGLLTLRTVLSTAAAPPERPSEALEAQAQEDAAHAQRFDDETDSESDRVRRSRRQFFVGQWIDVKDTVNQWLECTIMAMADDQVLVHYHGWPSRWDEWLDVDSPRIAAFRTRTVHAANAAHVSPMPLTRLAGAPSVGGTQSVQSMVTAVRDVLRDLVPHIERFAALCDDEVTEPLAPTDADERAELAHLIAPLFDRFGRVLTDSAHTLEPLLRPEIQDHARARQAQQTRAAAAVRTRTSRQPAPPPSDLELRDTSLSVRDLISTAPAAPVAEPTPSTRRNIDVHIHAIVAPSSLSSLASMLQGAGSTTTRTRVLESATAPVGRDFDEAFELPTYRQPLGSGTGVTDSRALLNDEADDDSDDVESDSRTDQSRLPLLSAYRRSGSSSSSSTTGGARPRRTVDETLDRFLADDFFGTSFGHDSDDDGDDSGHHTDDHASRDAAAAANSRSLFGSGAYTPLSSPPQSPIEPARASGLGEIPEIAAANARAQSDHAHEQRSDRNSSASASSSSGGGYPSFLEFMRRSLRRNFGFASEDASPHESASAQSEDAAAAPSSDEDDDDDMPALTALASEHETEAASVSVAAVAHRRLDSAFIGARAREPSSSSIDEDEMPRSDDDDEEMDRVD